MKAWRSLPSTCPVPAVPPPVRGRVKAVRPRAPNAVLLLVATVMVLAVPVCSVIAPPLIVGATPVIAPIFVSRSWMVPVVRLISLVARLVGVLTMVIAVPSTVIVSPRTKLVVSEFVPAPPFNSVDVEICAGVVALLFLLAPVVVAEAARLLHHEEAVAVDRHVGGDRRGLHVALHGVGLARCGGDAAGELIVDAGVRDQIEEAGVDPLEGGGLRVGDVAGNVFQRIGLRAQARNGRGESAEDTHDIFSKFDPGGSPVSEEPRPRREKMSQALCQTVKSLKIK